MSSTKVLFIFSVLVVLFQTIRCDAVCEGIIPDAITRLQNGTIAVFQDKNFFFYEMKDKTMTGPCLINEHFKAMSGPVDAAVTFEGHDSVTEFVGSSVFFSKGHFYTFKNLRPYQVEWGALVYLPVNGKQNAMGASEEAKKLMVCLNCLRHSTEIRINWFLSRRRLAPHITIRSHPGANSYSPTALSWASISSWAQNTTLRWSLIWTQSSKSFTSLASRRR